MLSFDAHNSPKAEHLRDHDPDLPATSPLPTHSQRRTLSSLKVVHQSRKNRFEPDGLKIHARSHAHPHHTCHRPINCAMHSIHQRRLLLCSPPTIFRRNLAQRISRAPHKRRRRLQQPASLCPKQPHSQTIRRLPTSTPNILTTSTPSQTIFFFDRRFLGPIALAIALVLALCPCRCHCHCHCH